jgi:chloramphenicol-sensitive protein RarD
VSKQGTSVGQTRSASEERARGTAFGFSAYVLWGIFPLYWPLLRPAGALEILAHRFTESLIFLLLLNALGRSWPAVRAILRRPRTALLLLIAALLVSVNWGVFIWAVNTGNIVEGSLGYFINPIVSMTFGLVFFRERLRRMQWVAFAIAVVAVIVLTVDYGRPPWIALALGGSFALYGLTKKLANVEAIPSLTVETAYLTPVAIGYLIWLEMQGQAVFPHAGAGHATLMLLTGAITAIPLLLFGAAAIRIPLTTLGVLQYVGPTLQFLIGVFIAKEAMPPARLLGFTIVWLALAIFTADALRSAHERRRDRLAVGQPS